jgi:hypothetical protein
MQHACKGSDRWAAWCNAFCQESRRLRDPAGMSQDPLRFKRREAAESRFRRGPPRFPSEPFGQNFGQLLDSVACRSILTEQHEEWRPFSWQFGQNVSSRANGWGTHMHLTSRSAHATAGKRQAGNPFCWRESCTILRQCEIKETIGGE